MLGMSTTLRGRSDKLCRLGENELRVNIPSTEKRVESRSAVIVLFPDTS